MFTGQHLCCGLFLIKLQLYQNETPIQVFSCEYCEVFKNTCFEKHLRMAVSLLTYISYYTSDKCPIYLQSASVQVEKHLLSLKNK